MARALAAHFHRTRHHGSLRVYRLFTRSRSLRRWQSVYIRGSVGLKDIQKKNGTNQGAT